MHAPASKTAFCRKLIGLLAPAAACLLAAPAFAAVGLLDAVKADNLPAVKQLIQAHADPNAAETDGTTALQWAVSRRDAKLVEVLLDAGARAGAVNRYGVGALYLACQNGDAAVVAALLRHGADPNAAVPGGETPLMTAARTGDVATLEALVAAGAHVGMRESRKGQTALMWAAAENNAAAVKFLLEHGAERDAKSNGGEFTAFTFAVRGGAVDAVRALLEAGADANAKLTDGTSALVLAVENAHYELASVLLEHGADPNAHDQGWTALHQITWSRQWNVGFNLPGPARTGTLSSLDLVRQLVAHGADVNARLTIPPRDGNRNMLNRIGATPFLLAAKRCDLPLMHLLLDLGADPSVKTGDGTTALMAAAGIGIWAQGEDPGTIEEALAAVKLAFQVGGGKINDANAHGETALHGAAYRGAIPVIKWLVEHGARLDAVNDKGWMPVTITDGVEYTPCVIKLYPEAAALLRSYMAKQGLHVPPPPVTNSS
ncbi:MAG TPA: ankyrin repeat domain-containing protein [Gammaproteobacteria bacterium]|nr:ankyrin repeat domain-containing protein [Gammaproteobacteria bacterium]